MLSNSDNIIFDCLDLRSVCKFSKESMDCLLNDHDKSHSQPRSNHIPQQQFQQRILKKNDSQHTIQLPNQQEQPKTSHTLAYEPVKRCVRQLECRKEIRKQQQHLGAKGRTKQTQNMGKRYKTITAAFLSMLCQAKVVNHSQQQAINAFNSCNGSLKDFQELFESQKLRKLCRGFFSSKEYISFILQSIKMDMRNKLIMIKHAEKLHSFTYNQTSGWKIES